MHQRTRDNRGTENLNGFTLIELLVVVAIIGLLLAVLIPGLSLAREAGNEIVCRTQLDQIFKAWFIYVEDDPQRRIPDTQYQTYRWAAQITNAMGTLEPGIFRCPSDEKPQRNLPLWVGAGYYVDDDRPDGELTLVDLPITYKARCDMEAGMGLRMMDFKLPNREILLVEGNPSTHAHPGWCLRVSNLFKLSSPLAPATYSQYHTWTRHTGTTNLLFLDGHIERVTPIQVGELAIAQQYGGRR